MIGPLETCRIELSTNYYTIIIKQSRKIGASNVRLYRRFLIHKMIKEPGFWCLIGFSHKFRKYVKYIGRQWEIDV